MIVSACDTDRHLIAAPSFRGTQVTDTIVTDRPPDRTSVFSTNDTGETYGTVSQAGGLSGDLPDLIAARATNGECGYITREDYFWSSGNAGTREEALALMIGYQQNAAIAFCEYIQARTGVMLDVNYVYDLMGDVGCWCNGWRELTEQQRASFIDLLPEEYKTPELAHQAYNAAMRANDVSIPVYARDGVTIIGEFIVTMGSPD